MPLPRHLSAYADIERVLRAALAADGALISFEDHGKAKRWQMRAYYYRKLLRETSGLQEQHKVETPYDEMIIRLDGPKLEIKFEAPQIPVSITTLDGAPLDLPELEEEEDEDDDMVNQAKRLLIDIDPDD